MCKNHAYFFPVNMLIMWRASFLATRYTIPCILIHVNTMSPKITQDTNVSVRFG